MAAEAAVLGTPGIRFNDFVGKLGYLEELEHKYKLTFGIKTAFPDKLLNKVEDILNVPDIDEVWRKRREYMLNNTIDVGLFFNVVFRGISGKPRKNEEKSGSR